MLNPLHYPKNHFIDLIFKNTWFYMSLRMFFLVMFLPFLCRLVEFPGPLNIFPKVTQ